MNFSFEWIASHRWAILPEMMHVITKQAVASMDSSVVIKEALTVRDGEIPQWSYRAEAFGSVAVIPIIGPIYSRGSYYYGGSSVNLIAKDFVSALEDPKITAIVFNVNSPGGEITGVSELANLIYESRGTKPIISYINGIGASAAYWIASAADKVVIADTGEAGSIGVVSVHTDYTDYDKRLGIKEIDIVSSQSPKKRLDVTTSEGKAEVQRIVDELADIFVSNVARNRKVSTDKVVSDFGQGSILIGKSSVDAGSSDEIGSLESVLKSLSVNKPTFLSGGIPMNIEELKAKHPDTYSAVLSLGKTTGVDETKASTEASASTAKTAGAAEERLRIAGIMSLKIPGTEAIVAENLLKPEATKSSVAILILEAQQAGKLALSTALAADNTSLLAGLKNVESNAPAGGKELTEEQLGRQMAALADGVAITDDK